MQLCLSISQNHRLAWVKSDLKNHYFQTPCREGGGYVTIDDAEALFLNILLLNYRRGSWGCCARAAEKVGEAAHKTSSGLSFRVSDSADRSSEPSELSCALQFLKRLLGFKHLEFQSHKLFA